MLIWKPIIYFSLVLSFLFSGSISFPWLTSQDMRFSHQWRWTVSFPEPIALVCFSGHLSILFLVIIKRSQCFPQCLSRGSHAEAQHQACTRYRAPLTLPSLIGGIWKKLRGRGEGGASHFWSESKASRTQKSVSFFFFSRICQMARPGIFGKH